MAAVTSSSPIGFKEIYGLSCSSSSQLSGRNRSQLRRQWERRIALVCPCGFSLSCFGFQLFPDMSRSRYQHSLNRALPPPPTWVDGDLALLRHGATSSCRNLARGVATRGRDLGCSPLGL
ncbi:hypothetical protein Salat_0638000 [Sesamum alatum]|uniref:Uncharacterized protein n=1 Tax=Sesamum alatum TaxID=300844 RepID=A0AAE2CU73_9LAMI|nr:hypothetical protein Salat_0638000 [Sesamum alatum]